MLARPTGSPLTFLGMELLAIITYEPNAFVISILVGIVLPLLTGVITKIGAGSALKAATNAVLSVVAGVITNLAVNPQIDVQAVLFSIALAFVSSVATYHSLWVPTDVVRKVQVSTANFGLGSNQPTGE